MLGKLLKYEIKATARILLPMYAAILLFAGINKLFMELNAFNNSFDVVVGIAVFIYVLIIIATFVLTFFVMIQRFYKNLLSDEGYLMFTLPVKPHMHIISKGLIAIMWNVVSLIFIFASIFIIAVDKDVLNKIPEILTFLSDQAMAVFGAKLTPFIVEVILMMIVGAIFGTLMIYTAIAIGHLFNNHKILASFGAYIALDIILQIINVVAISILSVSHSSIFENTVTFPADFFVSSLLPILLIIYTVFSAVYFIVTNYIFTKKLNLE